MKEQTCIIIGGGYAGLNAINAIRKTMQGIPLQIILIDKQPHHLRKVLLFKAAAAGTPITIPFEDIFTEGISFLQGMVKEITSEEKRLQYEDAKGNSHQINYDILIVTVGSVIRKPALEQGGMALTDLNAGASIRQQWLANLQKAAKETNRANRQRLLTVAVAGAGISGIETSAELAYEMRKEAAALRLDPAEIRVFLINAQERLFPEGPAKVGRKLEIALNKIGVTVLHRCKAMQEKEGVLMLTGSKPMPVGLCIWTLGLLPNPVLRSFGLPLTPEGQVIVDASYRVKGAPGVYSIGDCAHITDPANGRPDRMTCKEAVAQATRLVKVISADLNNRPAPTHQTHMDFFCIGLGPEQGMVWTRHWGLDFILTGKLGWKIRKFTWDSASLVK
ncbi:dehydrogenase [Paenibacillus baekrokdamisoli]|uniref:Dehydrogenase n=1 Tax=Paenibacillus baekrokdamisoli TaxID=1712516 RepID=A0A3G9JAM3_9BACL|nr:FAD-dependent oxidoreductase [Paenibacillus baekrokdamisoli]MBB3072032.1 NADH dehydrogenase [Paenibacillus baekrokdamisoli]BBH20334.1 dehydrogenase [Paenibacillus baekrokdamisoli]